MHFFKLLDANGLVLASITLLTLGTTIGILAALSTLVYNLIKIIDHYKTKKDVGENK